jgi:hypothetical protein
MNTYLDQIGRQELVRQYFEQISQASAIATIAPETGNSNLSDNTSKAHPVRSKSRLTLPWFNRSAVEPQS